MHHLFALLLCCLLLTGCGARSPGAPGQVPPTGPGALYEAGSPMEQQTHGAVRTYSLPMADVRGIRAMGSHLLVFSGADQTTLTRLTGEALVPTASVQLDFLLDPGDHSLVIREDGLSFYDPVRDQTLVLDDSLTERRAIASPQDMAGVPILSRDGKVLYYTTLNGVRAWDLETGLRRLLRSLTRGNLTGLHMDDTLLQCTTADAALLISVTDGRLLWEGDKALRLTTQGGRYYAALPIGLNPLFLFGQEAPQSLTTADFNSGDCFFLERKNAVVAAVTGQETVLSCYDLNTGLRSSILSLSALDSVQVEDCANGQIYILAQTTQGGSQVLYRWDPDRLPADDPASYTAPYSTSPDQEGLARCQAYADEIGRRYGLTVLIGDAAADTHPWDYDFEPEHLTPFLQKELELLDASLANFPKSILEDTVSHFSSLTVCLVRSITGTAASGSVEAADGLQFLDGTDVYLALAVGPHSDQPLYHELFHVMETRLLSSSTGFDQWDNTNPADFAYSYGYAHAGDYDRYLQGERRAFIDSYSMTFPKEDRARIMEYAMTPGHGELFHHKLLQVKLDLLCRSIRQAYGLKKSPEVYLWEQYLDIPLAYTK